MRLESAFRLLFVVYCLEAGLFFSVAPWTGTWERLALVPELRAVQPLLADSWTRGLTSGLGLVHLLWAVHDVDLLLSSRRRAS
ncbi:MAG TPA: hypothetical protein VLA66_07990 [Thermoanaerobaculia bacterium]|nr:hypothetical protein [Thermoanaerobaculia bacterium]